MQKKWLDYKGKINFKIYDFNQLNKQTITIHILYNISRIKDNQEMEFGQSIEYDMRKI